MQLVPRLEDDAARRAVVLLVVDLELDQVDAQPLRVGLLHVRVELPGWKFNRFKKLTKKCLKKLTKGRYLYDVRKCLDFLTPSPIVM